MGGKMPRSYHREYELAYYARPDVKARRAALMKKYRNDPALREKHKARWKVNRAIASGRLIKEPCACGSTKVQAHHDDYAKPLDVSWLCIACHSAEHARDPR